MWEGGILYQFPIYNIVKLIINKWLQISVYIWSIINFE